jgi:hypothetical protein
MSAESVATTRAGEIGAKIVRRGCYAVLQLAEVAMPRALFAETLPDRWPAATIAAAADMRIGSDERLPFDRRVALDSCPPSRIAAQAPRSGVRTWLRAVLATGSAIPA